MNHDFWHQKWRDNQINFHAADVNAHLQRHFADLDVATGGQVFVPLCGKSNDLGWLADQGYRVTGAELSETAVAAFFAERGLSPEITTTKGLRRYAHGAIELYAGDIFELDAALLGQVDTIYDRAALVALPAEMRRIYAAHLTTITGSAPQLLISFDYDQSHMSGPPFSVTGAEIRDLYSDAYAVHHLGDHPITGPLAERSGGGLETVWHLIPN